MAHATLSGMLPGRFSLTLALLAALALGRRARAEEVYAERAICTLVPLDIRLRSPDMVAFIGTVDADTVLAGAGAQRYTTEQGHYGSGTRRLIFGQTARVDRPERAAPQALREAIATNRAVVLVPWDFSASCEPVPWTRSARWLAPGKRGVFVGTLRDRAHWVGARPTFDVTPEVAVYPSPWPIPGARRPDGPVLSADEFLSLYEVLPDGESLEATPVSAVAPLLRWAQAFPKLAAKQPAAYVLAYLRDEVVEQQYMKRPSPLAGTYRVVFRTAAGDSSAFFARTELRPSSVISSDDPTPAVSGGERRPRIIGHYLLAVAARTLSELPTRRVGSGQFEGYFALVDSSTERTAHGATFLGSIDLEREAAGLVSDSVARSHLEDAGRQKSAFQTELFRRKQPLAPGRFVIAPVGDVHFEMVIKREGVPILTVRAARISGEHLQVRNP
jgi:hypothetical protein